ncbi:MAG: hypothetical protein ACRDD8_14695 [Bacteroidales bacterium]
MAKPKDERKLLENLLFSSNTNNINGDEVPNTETLVMANLFDDDLIELQKQCEKDAKSLVEQSIRHIFTKKLIREHSYIKDKIKIDIEVLSGILYQDRCARIMQRTLMNEIRLGAASPRNFEVFSNMSKTIAENNKQLLATVEAIKATYNNILTDISQKEQLLINEGSTKSLSASNGPSENPSDDVRVSEKGVSSVGSKGIIEMIKQASIQAKLSEDENN